MFQIHPHSVSEDERRAYHKRKSLEIADSISNNGNGSKLKLCESEGLFCYHRRQLADKMTLEKVAERMRGLLHSDVSSSSIIHLEAAAAIMPVGFIICYLEALGDEEGMGLYTRSFGRARDKYQQTVPNST